MPAKASGLAARQAGIYNPFLVWIPAGAYPHESGGGNDRAPDNSDYKAGEIFLDLQGGEGTAKNLLKVFARREGRFFFTYGVFLCYNK